MKADEVKVVWDGETLHVSGRIPQAKLDEIRRDAGNNSIEITFEATPKQILLTRIRRIGEEHWSPPFETPFTQKAQFARTDPDAEGYEFWIQLLDVETDRIIPIGDEDIRVGRFGRLPGGAVVEVQPSDGSSG